MARLFSTAPSVPRHWPDHWRGLPWDRLFPLLVLIYCSLHLAVRLWASPNIGTDDVEQALMAQSWRWGYNPAQPPLYTWLLLGTYGLLGPGVLAHMLLKYLLVAGCYLSAWLAARQMLPAAAAALATASLLLLFGFGWGVHAGVTHTLTLTILLFLSLAVLIRLGERPGWGLYGLLGLCAGLGLLSKYSFGLFLLPLLLAMLLEPVGRRILRHPGMILAALIALLVALPHGLWMIDMPRDYAGRLATLAGRGEAGGAARAMLTGFGSLAQAGLTFLAPFWALALVLFTPALFRPATGRADPWTRILAWTVGFGLLALAFTIVGGGATQFKDRRMHPILVGVPLLTLLAIATAPLARWRWRVHVGLLITIATISLLALIGQALFEPKSCRNCRLHAPMPALAQTLAAQGIGPGTILAGDEHLGGNLRLHLPAAVAVPLYGDVLPPPGDPAGQCVLVWNSRGTVPPALPGALAAFAGRAYGIPAAELADTPASVALPLLRNAGRAEPFAWLVLTERDGQCRSRR